MHRLVQEIAQYQLPTAEKAGWLQRSLQMLDDFCTGDPSDVNTWAPIYTPARPHLSRILPAADKAGIAIPTARLMNALGSHLQARADFAEAEPLFRRALLIDETSYGPNHPA
ncbi:MAG: tetratricopeptide repeat protein, partial [Planctomycetaceae bacterium]